MQRREKFPKFSTTGQSENPVLPSFTVTDCLSEVVLQASSVDFLWLSEINRKQRLPARRVINLSGRVSATKTQTIWS